MVEFWGVRFLGCLEVEWVVVVGCYIVFSVVVFEVVGVCGELRVEVGVLDVY